MKRRLERIRERVHERGPKTLVHELGLRLGLGHNRLEKLEILGQQVVIDHRSRPGRGGCEADEGWTFALVRSSTAFVDAGSNTGQFSLLACLDSPVRRVLCIDANPTALAVAAGSLVRNGFADRTSFACGFLSDAPGEDVQFFTAGTMQAGSAHADHVPHAAGASISVATITLDEVCSERHFEPDLVKLDVEGAEAEALRGATELVRRHRPRIIVEMHAVAARSMAENGDLVLKWCSDVGYQAWYLKTGDVLTDSSPIAARGRCHLLLLDRDEPFPEALAGMPAKTPYTEVASAR